MYICCHDLNSPNFCTTYIQKYFQCCLRDIICNFLILYTFAQCGGSMKACLFNSTQNIRVRFKAMSNFSSQRLISNNIYCIQSNLIFLNEFQNYVDIFTIFILYCIIRRAYLFHCRLILYFYMLREDVSDQVKGRRISGL